MSEARDPIEIACPKCRHQINPSLAGLQVDINSRCPNCGQLLGVKPAIYKKLFQAAADEYAKGVLKDGKH